MQELQAFEYRNLEWLVGYVQVCESVQNQEPTGHRIMSKSLSVLLDHVYARNLQWIKEDPKIKFSQVQARDAQNLQNRIYAFLHAADSDYKPPEKFDYMTLCQQQSDEDAIDKDF